MSWTSTTWQPFICVPVERTLYVMYGGHVHPDIKWIITTGSSKLRPRVTKLLCESLCRTSPEPLKNHLRRLTHTLPSELTHAETARQHGDVSNDHLFLHSVPLVSALHGARCVGLVNYFTRHGLNSCRNTYGSQDDISHWVLDLFIASVLLVTRQ